MNEAEQFIRYAQRRDWIDLSATPSDYRAFSLREGVVAGDRTTQLEAYLCESLATALSPGIEPVIRLRATFQAYEYKGKLEGLGFFAGAELCYGVRAARNQIEDLLRC